jgi:hypothetical protein
VWHRAPPLSPSPSPLFFSFFSNSALEVVTLSYMLTLLLALLALLYGMYEIKVIVLVLTQPRDACSLHCLLQVYRQCISTDFVMTSSAPMNASPNASVTSVMTASASARRGPLRGLGGLRGRRA